MTIAAGFFDQLPPAARARLAAIAEPLDLGPGVTFLREGEPTAFMAVILGGHVALRLRVPERGPVTILTLDREDLVGWSAIVAPFRSTSSATTLERTQLAILDAGPLRTLLDADEAVAAALLPLILRTVSDRLVATRDQLLDLFTARGIDPW